MAEEFLSLLTVLVFAVLAALVRIYVPLAIAALNRKAEAVLGTANRDALYAAVKVGLNAANKHGLNGDDLLKKAISVASMYLNQHHIPVSTALLNEAIRAEQQKRQDRKAELGTFANPLPDSAVLGYPAPTIELTSDGMTKGEIHEFIVREIEKARMYEASYGSLRGHSINQNNNDNDKPR